MTFLGPLAFIKPDGSPTAVIGWEEAQGDNVAISSANAGFCSTTTNDMPFALATALHQAPTRLTGEFEQPAGRGLSNILSIAPS